MKSNGIAFRHLSKCDFLFNLSGEGDAPKERREPISVDLELGLNASR